MIFEKSTTWMDISHLSVSFHLSDSCHVLMTILKNFMFLTLLLNIEKTTVGQRELAVTFLKEIIATLAEVSLKLT